MGFRGCTHRLLVIVLVLGPAGSDLVADEKAGIAEPSSLVPDALPGTGQPAARSTAAGPDTALDRPPSERKRCSSWLTSLLARRAARTERSNHAAVAPGSGSYDQAARTQRPQPQPAVVTGSGLSDEAARTQRPQPQPAVAVGSGLNNTVARTVFDVLSERAEQDSPSPPQPSVVSNIPPAIFQPGAPGYPELSQIKLPSPGPSGEAAAATSPEAPALTPLYLNRGLHLEDSPIRIYGFIENGFNGNTNGLPRNRENFSIYSDHLSDQWIGNQYYLVMDDPLEAIDEFNVGFRVDFLFGNDWLVTKAYGLFDNGFPINHFPGIDLPQVYAEAHLPILTPGGIDLRAGRFYSLIGFESPPAVARPLYSMAYSLPYTPFTFFGAIGTVHLSDRLNFVAGTIDGYDRWPNKPYKWGFLSALTWTSRDQKLNIVLGGADAYDQLPRFPPADATYVPDGIPPPPFLAGRRNPFYNKAGRGYAVAVATYKWSDKLIEALQTDHVFDQMTLGFSPTPYIPKSAAYHIFAHWFLYQFTEKITGVWRTEILWDPYGLATGNPDTLHEMTLGLNIRPKPWLWVRPEARYDWSQFTHPYNDGTRNSQFTLAFDVIVLF
jgi:hypothetical protein